MGTAVDFPRTIVSDLRMMRSRWVRVSLLMLVLPGLQIAGAYPDHAFTVGIHATDSLLAEKLGVKFLRLWGFQEVLNGDLIETTTNRWRDCAAQLEAMRSAALIPVGVLYTRQPWRCSSDGMPDLGLCEGVSPWMQYVDAVTRRYRGQVRFWEVWNEPDVRAFGGERTPAQYVELVRQAAAVIRRNDAGVVIGGGVAEPLKPWILDCLNAGLAEHIDVLSVHYGYTGDPHRDKQLTYINRIRQLRSLSGKPIWNTETSILRQWADGTSEKDFYYQPEGRALDRILRVNQEAGVQVVFYYYLGPPGVNNPESLLDAHRNLRPWAWVLRNYR
jgi:hypothetical protein